MFFFYGKNKFLGSRTAKYISRCTYHFLPTVSAGSGWLKIPNTMMCGNTKRIPMSAVNLCLFKSSRKNKVYKFPCCKKKYKKATELK